MVMTGQSFSLSGRLGIFIGFGQKEWERFFGDESQLRLQNHRIFCNCRSRRLKAGNSEILVGRVNKVKYKVFSKGLSIEEIFTVNDVMELNLIFSQMESPSVSWAVNVDDLLLEGNFILKKILLRKVILQFVSNFVVEMMWELICVLQIVLISEKGIQWSGWVGDKI